MKVPKIKSIEKNNIADFLPTRSFELSLGAKEKCRIENLYKKIGDQDI